MELLNTDEKSNQAFYEAFAWENVVDWSDINAKR